MLTLALALTLALTLILRTTSAKVHQRRRRHRRHGLGVVGIGHGRRRHDGAEVDGGRCFRHGRQGHLLLLMMSLDPALVDRGGRQVVRLGHSCRRIVPLMVGGHDGRVMGRSIARMMIALRWSRLDHRAWPGAHRQRMTIGAWARA